MKKYLVAALLAATLPAAAFAQEASPNGSRPFGIEPYVGVLGGYHSFDRDSAFGTSGNRGKMDGALLSGIAGVNIPLNAFFVGVEGNATKGFKDINWEYGVKGRAGFRAGESGLIFLSAGYQWVDGRSSRGFPNRHDVVYGGGVEVGPKDIGLGGLMGSAGPRLRFQVDTYDMKSIRPMAGLVFHL